MLTRDRIHRHHVSALVRDIVEVVAIIAAGIWALYTFVYAERVKPASERPTVQLTGSLHRLGERGGLVQMEYQATVRNIGHTRVNIIAVGFTVNGVKYTNAGTPATIEPFNGTSEFFRSARILSVQPVFRAVELTRFVKPEYGGGYEIDPGGQIPYSGIFLVRRNEFDTLTFDGSVADSKYDGTYPTKTSILPNGAVYFTSTNHDSRYSSVQVTLDRTTLW
jgi:hypothetical protein